MNLKNPKNLRKRLRKSPDSNAWAAYFKNADFFLGVFTSNKIE